MNSLDRELKNALRREEPPADFAERVMARIPLSATPVPDWRGALRNAFRLPALRWATVAAMCLTLAIGLLSYRRHQRAQRAEGEMARAQVMLALHIASAKLNVTMREVERADQPPRARSNPKSERQMEHL